MKNAKKHWIVACIFFIIPAITLTSCSQVMELTGQSTSSESTTSTSLTKGVAPQQETATEEATKSKDTGTKSADKTNRLIVRKKSMSVEVDDVRETYKEIEKLASKYEGRITGAAISSNQYPIISSTTPESGTPPSSTFKDDSSEDAGSKTDPLYATVVLKVPSEKTSAAFKDIKKLGEVETEQEEEEEVTEQYVDLNARLRNLQREEQRYLEFFNAAKTVEDMLKIEEQLSRVRGEIESLQAQIDHLEKSAQMGTITVYMHEPPSVSKPISDWGFTKALIQAVENFVMVINFLIMLTGALLPLIIIILIIILLIKAIFRRRKKQPSS